jgi:hypothetical protein
VNLAALWETLTWHTLIEVVAIIVAAIIVHPIISAVRRGYEWVLQKIASLSKNRSIKRTKRLFDYYSHIWRKRESMKQDSFHVSLIVASENLGILLTGIVALFVGNSFDILSIPVGLALLGYVFVRYNKITAERHNIVHFDAFRSYTQSKILELRPIANNDAQLEEWWRSYFNEEINPRPGWSPALPR